jgi:hypothetical protein
MVALSKVMRWETAADAGGFDRAMTPDEIMDKLEKRVGPEGRKLFEQFLRTVSKLQARQQSEAEVLDRALKLLAAEAAHREPGVSSGRSSHPFAPRKL